MLACQGASSRKVHMRFHRMTLLIFILSYKKSIEHFPKTCYTDCRDKNQKDQIQDPPKTSKGK